MKISKVWAVYFSPVGSTGKMAEIIAREAAKVCRVPVEIYDFTLPRARGGIKTFGGDELVVFATPTYAGRVPNKALPFVQELFQGKNTPAIAAVTFGNRNFDSSLTELAQELGEHGFRVLSAGGFVSRHVFSSQLAKGRPDAEDKALMRDFARRSAEKLLSAENAEALTAPVIRDGAPVAPYYVPRGIDGQPAKFLKAKPVTDMDKCTNCKVCAEVCPMGSIDKNDITQVPGVCIKCQACVRLCPYDAKYFADEAFLSHVAMLEQNFTRPAENEVYL